jgi:hypothetical protein
MLTTFADTNVCIRSSHVVGNGTLKLGCAFLADCYTHLLACLTLYVVRIVLQHPVRSVPQRVPWPCAFAGRDRFFPHPCVHCAQCVPGKRPCTRIIGPQGSEMQELLCSDNVLTEMRLHIAHGTPALCDVPLSNFALCFYRRAPPPRSPLR